MKKKINAAFIRTFNPCESGIVNFETRYPNFEGTIIDILKLEHISYNDKIWLAVKVVDIKILNVWSVECAESVLHNFEKQFPEDKRIRDCLNTTKLFIMGEVSLDQLLAAAESAAESAWSAAESAAWSARSAAWSARSAAWSAAESAWSARSAAWSARSAAWSARSAAESAAWSARSAEEAQEELNINLLIALLEEHDNKD
jgi:hypothetical protein